MEQSNDLALLVASGAERTSVPWLLFTWQKRCFMQHADYPVDRPGATRLQCVDAALGNIQTGLYQYQTIPTIPITALSCFGYARSLCGHVYDCIHSYAFSFIC